jgi:hypothetical protein
MHDLFVVPYQRLSFAVRQPKRDRFNFTLDPQAVEPLKEMSERTGASLSKLVERAIKRFSRDVEKDPLILLNPKDD